jgi:hypothetical protein
LLASCVVLHHELYFTSYWNFSALWAASKSCVKLVKLNIEIPRHWRKNIDVTSGGCNLERLGTFALLVNVNGLAWLHAEARTVYSRTVHKDVAVNNHLTRLGNGSCEAGAKN